LTRATLLQFAFGAVVLLGLAAAAVWRAPGPASPAASPPAPEAADPLPASAANRAPPPLPAAPPATATPPPSASSLDESSLMAELRRARNSDPQRAVRLAEEGNRRFPDSPDAPERTAILIHALAEQGQRTEARRSAEEMVNHYPDSAWVRDVEVFTGAHRHRSIRLNDEGGLEYY
jgi:hypothetical protein